MTFLIIGLTLFSLCLANDNDFVASKFHRKNSGKPDLSGWFAAASTEGGYTVRLPCPFDDFTETDGARKRYVLECLHGNYKKFVVKKYEYRNIERAKQKFRKIREDVGFLFSVTESTYQGNPSIESSGSSPGECMYMQTVYAKSSVIFMAAVDNETPKCPNLEAMSRQFFNSLIFNKN
ncbi:MAG: hypothetical protein WA159_14685 [Variovorax sp.]